MAESLQRYAGYYGFTVKTAASDKLFKHTEDNTVLLADSTMEDISSESEFIYQLTQCKQKNGLFKTSLKYNGLDSVAKLHLIPLRLSQINLLVGDDIANGQLQYPIEYYDKEQGLSKISALVVEDNPDNIFVLEQQLESIGVNATFCESPEAAVTVFKNGEFNLVISDYQMPELSGAELTEILRKVEIEQERLPCTIVVLTADKTEACQNACQRSGVDNIFIKPLSLSNLHTFLCKFNLYLKSNEHVEVEDNIELVDEFSHRNDLFLDDYNELIDGKETESIDIGPSKDSNYIPMDVTQIYQFTGDLSDKELNEFLLHFKGNLGRRLRTLEFSVKNDDFAKIHSVAHTIKSSSLYVGAQTLSQSCQKLEDAAKKNPIDRNLIQSLWRETEKEMNVVLDFFKEMDLSE